MKNKTFKKLIAMLLVIAMIIPTFGMMYTSAATGDTVELAFNNIFVFEAWANNTLSSTVLVDGVPQEDGIVKDLENGSFTLTKEVATSTELYTAFSLDAANAAVNEPYYTMDVEPNTTYTFSYDVTGNVYVFTPYVFFYNAEGLWIENGLVAYGTPGYGYNEFSFTTPAGATGIQIRFTIGDNSSAGNTTATTVSATVKDIAIFKSELKSQYLSSQNMFDFEAWASNESSMTSADTTAGTFTADTSSKTVSFTNTPSGGSYLWTGFGIDGNASNDAYYTIDVSPNTSYTLTYDITDSNLLGPIYCQPFIVEMDENGKCITYYGYETPQLLGNKRVFTTQANTARIQVVFAVINEGTTETRSCKVSNIGVYDTTVLKADFETVTGYPHRLAYTEGAGTYGELPTPTNVPSGMYFAGWFTGQNGSGEAITADTEISYKSYTVYPYYQIAVDKLEIKTPPVKTTYTLGEKLNTTGLVLTGTVGDSTFDISSGYICSPTVLNSSGTQAITVSYGGQTATFNVDVSLFNEKTIPVNDTEVVAQVTNNVYTINYTAPEAFSRYEITYYSDSYVKGTITMADGTYEEFFLEPATNGSFASYIDDYLTGGTYSDIQSIGFECLNKEFGTFELYSVETVYVEKPANTMAYYENERFKAGINLAWGGVLAYLQDLNQTKPVVAVKSSDGTTKVNYESQLTGNEVISTEVNLINTFDKGRYVQQSYYGTREEPYVTGNYNGVEWNYNPIQGGNILGEAAKVVDYRITDTEIYVKTRPLEWAKWSDEAGAAYNEIQPDDSKDKELIYEDSYNPWAYMESWYVFEDGMIKTYCRYVDYSGYPSATTTQEFPAFYCVEPLNNFVYYAGGEAWDDATNTAHWESDLDFWGASPEYNQMLIDNGLEAVDPHFDCNENWAAFMGGTTNEDFGIGIYTADVTDFVAGSYNTKYQDVSGQGLVPQVTYARHSVTADPATEDPTSYIAPINTMELESYKEYTYAYYITTGTQEEIREDFRRAVDEDVQAEYAKTKVAVPETAYMKPATSPDATTTVGQYYVNNILDSSDYYNIKTEASATAGMYFGVHSANATQYKISVTNATNPADDIILGNANGTGNVEGTWFNIGDTGNDIKDNVYSLRFASTGLKPGEIATAKWEITIQYEDGTTKTYNAYTVMYAPMTTVGAVAESRRASDQNNEISSWITGANGIDHSRTAPLGSFSAATSASGYFKYDPLAYPEISTIADNITGSSQSANDYINVGTDSSDYYVQQTATSGAQGSRSHSYLGLLAIDKSRYSNTNQIPNLEIGYDVLRIAELSNNSLEAFSTYYTLGTSESFTSTSLSDTPSNWTVNSSYNRPAGNGNAFSVPYRETVVPSYAVSDDMDGKYIHALSFGSCQGLMSYNYATAGTSVLIDVTDKSALRDAVTDGYTLPEENYSDDSYSQFEKELEEAATVLGDPSASQDEIDQAQKELEDAKDELVNTYYALKYDSLFSAYEFSQKLGSMTMNVTSNASIKYTAGTLTVISDNAEKTDIYAKEGNTSNHYNIDVEPSTEYVFEYDVDTVAGSQVLLFFYDANGNQVASTNQTMQIGDGNPSNITSSPHFAAYVKNDGHVVLKFTTNANIDRIGFRFGNTDNVVNESTFTNIRLIEAEKYYADAEYSKTEAVYAEYDTYGTLITPVRPGYTFTGWVYEDGTAATAADLATAHKSVYSTWSANNYTINYDANGGRVSPTTLGYDVEDSVSLPTPTRGGYVFAGWEVIESDGNWTVGTVYPAGAVPKGMYGNVTLLAVWTDSEYTLTYNANGGSVSPESVVYNVNDSVTLATPTRNGYTFAGWEVTSSDGNWTVGTVYSAGTKLEKMYGNATLTAEWTVVDYTITYNANGGTVSPTSDTFNIEDTVSLPTPTRDGYIFAGWKVTSTDGNWTVGKVYPAGTVSEKNLGNVTLTAVWTVEDVVVLFDTILDFNDWDTSTASNATISNVTENGFTLTSNADVSEGTSTSPYFPVTAGKQYYVDIDFEGDNWDVYIFFYDDATSSGLGIDFNDGTNRFSSNGSGNTTRTFTAPAGATKAVIRVDANGSSNSVTFSDIRVYEAGTREADVDVPFSSKDAKYNSTYGELPVPTKWGYTFKGWYDENNNQVTATSTVTQETPVIYLHSVWEMNPPSAYEDAVVIDFSLPVRIHVCVNDQHLGAGTLTAIGTTLADGAQIGANAYTTSQLTDGVTSGLTLANGTAYIDGDTIVYTPSNTSSGSETVFYYEYKSADGKYYYTTVTVIPATSVYYEESFMTFVNGDGYNWEDVGATIEGKFQEEDRPGDFMFEDYDANNVYGNDSAYDDIYTYSMGSAKKATVDNAAFGKEPTANFTFCGTGFDLFSVTNNDTGAVLVTIYNAGTQTIVKNFLVSTYYGYTVDDDTGALLPDLDSTAGMYQVPVISYRDLNYGTYDVVIKPIYSRAFDPNYVHEAPANTNAYSIYVDSVRIFNPAGSGEDIKSDVVADAYFADGEFAPMYKEVRDTIISAEDYYDEVISNLELGYTGSLFVDGNATNGIDKDGIATYKTQGPNNEVYLGKNQAIAFNVSAEDAYTLASLQLGMKVVSGEKAEVAIMNTNDKTPTKINISGANEQFYKLDSAIIWNVNETTVNGVDKKEYQTAYPVVIVNTSDTVISLTSFKWAHTNDPETVNSVLTFNVDHSTGEMASYAVQRVMEQENTANNTDVSIKWANKTFVEGEDATLVITTSPDIVAVTVNGIEITDCEIDENGDKLWTYSFVVTESGETNYEIIFFDEEGIVYECIKTETIVIENAPATDNDTSDDNSDADNSDVDVVKSIFEIILDFIKKILSLVGGVSK